MHTALFQLKKADVADDEISQRAYGLWLKRGRPKGHESEIWREAKLELESESWMKANRRRFFQKARDSFSGLCVPTPVLKGARVSK